MIFNDIYGLNFVVEYHLEYRFPKRYYFAVAWDSNLRPGSDAGSERSTVIELSRGIHRTTVMATYLAFVGVGFGYLCPGSRSSVRCTTGQSFAMSNDFSLERALRAGLVYLQSRATIRV